MTRDYGKIRTKLWRSQKFRRLREAGDDDARLLYFYLHTCRSLNSVGCFELPAGYAESDLGWPAERVAKAFDSLSEVSLVALDRADEVVRIVDYPREDPFTNRKHALGGVRAALALPDCLQKLLVLRDLQADPHAAGAPGLAEAVDRLSKAYRTPLPFPLPEPLPLARQAESEPGAARGPAACLAENLDGDPGEGPGEDHGDREVDPPGSPAPDGPEATGEDPSAPCAGDLLRALADAVCRTWGLAAWYWKPGSRAPAEVARAWLARGLTPERLVEIAEPLLLRDRAAGRKPPERPQWLDPILEEALAAVAAEQRAQAAELGAALSAADPRDSRWPVRVAAWRERGFWHEAPEPHGWGPRPDEPGCRCPESLLEAADREPRARPARLRVVGGEDGS